MARTPTRPALLSSKIARGNLRQPPTEHVAGALAVLDRLSGIWDALEAVRSTRDPTLTTEAAALRYREAFERATTQANREVRAAAERLTEHRAQLHRDARGRAGLLAQYPGQEELRAVLRGMSVEDRDAAIMHAADTGDAVVMAAIQAHELLVGATTIPIRTITDTYVAARAPDIVAQMSEADTALEHLEMAWSSFARSAEDMRDLRAEERGEEGASAARDAEAMLGRALA